MYFAHSAAAQRKDKWQSLQEHLNQVAAMAARFAAPFGAERAAAFAGLLHDLGKYTSAFQSLLDGDKAKVDHSTAGARQACALANSQADKGTAELIAYAIAGHHSGLPDKIDGDASLTDRLKKHLPPLDPHWRIEIAPDTDNLWPNLQLDRSNKAKAAFQLGFLGRMIFSCLVDADYRTRKPFTRRSRDGRQTAIGRRSAASLLNCSALSTCAWSASSRKLRIRASTGRSSIERFIPFRAEYP